MPMTELSSVHGPDKPTVPENSRGFYVELGHRICDASIALTDDDSVFTGIPLHIWSTNSDIEDLGKYFPWLDSSGVSLVLVLHEFGY
jgi:hypothetical protein